MSIEDIPEDLRTVERFQNENKVMIFGAISKKGKFPLKFIEIGQKINATYYKSEVLVKLVKVEGERMFGDHKWTFQQDSAPAHKAKIVQTWCKTEIPDFIATEDWPPSSPDLNPLDYCIWGVLEARVNAIRHKNLESLRASIRREWDRLSMEIVRKSIDSW